MSPVIASGPGSFGITMMLCDHAQVADGKLFISGGGWTVIGPDPSPFGLAVIVGVPWGLANKPVAFTLELIQEDGQTVMQPSSDGLAEAPTMAEGQFEVGRPVGLVEGQQIDFPMALNFGPLHLPEGSRLDWRLEVRCGALTASGSAPFSVRRRAT